MDTPSCSPCLNSSIRLGGASGRCRRPKSLNTESTVDGQCCTCGAQSRGHYSRMNRRIAHTSVAGYLDRFLLLGNDIAFQYRDGLRVRRWSYAEVARGAFQVARELQERNVSQGDRVLIQGRNSAAWVAAFFGCVRRGAIPVPLDLHSEPGFVARVQDKVEARFMFSDGAAADSNRLRIPVIRLDDLGSEISRHSSEPYPIAEIEEDDTVEIVFTSGTTAEPKGVRITHRNLWSNLAPIDREIARRAKWVRLVHPLRFLNLVPLSHVYGQFMGMFVPPLLRGTVCFQDSLVPAHVADTIRREHVSVLVCVPRTLETLRDKIERDYEADGRVESFRSRLQEAASSHVVRRWWTFRRVHQMFGWKFWAFITGGATLDAATEDFWQRLGFAVIQGYGMTETASLISVNNPRQRRRGSIGRVLPGLEVKLADNGEILVRGENVSPGYWREPPPEGSWLHTGDLGEFDTEGNLYFKGRQKEVIVTSSGMNVYPEDIELVLNQQPETRTSTVVAVDGMHGSEPLAVLILRNNHTDARAVIERANRALAEHQRVHRWAIWPEQDFPRTATQKIRKQDVAQRVAATPSAGLPAAPRVSHLRVETLDDVLARVTGRPVDQVHPAATLGIDLNVDSLGRVALQSALEDRYHVELDEAAFTEQTTVSDIHSLIQGARQNNAPRYDYPRWQHRWPTTWLRTALLAVVVLPLTRIMAWPTIRGKQRLAGVCGPVVFVCNHISLVDHAFVLLALPGALRRTLAIAMDAETLHKWRHPPTGTPFFVRLCGSFQYFLAIAVFNGFYLPQKSGFRRSFASAGELMDRGFSILIFPEGQRTKHGQLHPFLAGTGLLISQLSAPVVPMRIDGLWELRQARKRFARPGRVALTIGEPLRYSAAAEPERIAADLETVVRDL